MLKYLGKYMKTTLLSIKSLYLNSLTYLKIFLHYFLCGNTGLYFLNNTVLEKKVISPLAKEVSLFLLQAAINPALTTYI